MTRKYWIKGRFKDQRVNAKLYSAILCIWSSWWHCLDMGIPILLILLPMTIIVPPLGWFPVVPAAFPMRTPHFLHHWFIGLHCSLNFTAQSCTTYSSVLGHAGSLTALPGVNMFPEPWCEPPQPSHTYILHAYKTAACEQCQVLQTAQDGAWTESQIQWSLYPHS